jgi:asparagine synthase (glutamine-hydrolysing)
MCGIFGLTSISSTGIADTPDLAQKLQTALRHRGPDDSGWAAFAPDGRLLGTERDHAALGEYPATLLLGQTRLSIIDLSPAGHQPMFSPDGRHALVYNGEIYNYRELRAELENDGVIFRSRSDTEVLLHALIRWGAACLPRLTGMFAFALYDAEERTLLLARDCFGIKPLFYHYAFGSLAFASELPALTAFPEVRPHLAAQQAYNYLCFGKYDKGGETFFSNTAQIPPGHLLRCDIAGNAPPVLEQYWKPDLDKRSSLSFADAAARLRELFLDSVRLHLRADVPVGVALSGGIDSSATACAVRRLQPDAELHAFSFIAAGSSLSEERWAALAAAHAGAVRHTVEVEPHELVRDLDALCLAQGEPFGSTSIYAQYRVFRLVRESGIKVTLDGQGADELLAGYFGYPGQRAASLLLRGDLPGALRFMRAKSAWPGITMRDIARLTVREFTPPCLLPLALALVGHDPRPRWLDIARMREENVAFTVQDDSSVRFPSKDRVRRTLAGLLTWEGLPQLLRHGDRNAMAFSVESRVPFLTRETAEFCLSLPEDYLIDMNGRTKSVFREAMRGIVPDAILDRRDKIGFETPERAWLDALAPWVKETLGASRDIPWLMMDEVRKEWRAVREGRKRFDRRIWRMLNYIRWTQLFGLRA